MVVFAAFEQPLVSSSATPIRDNATAEPTIVMVLGLCEFDLCALVPAGFAVEAGRCDSALLACPADFASDLPLKFNCVNCVICCLRSGCPQSRRRNARRGPLRPR